MATSFCSCNHFHDKAGELHVLHKSGFLPVERHVSGDRRADFQIEVHSIAALVRADINL
jgi:hypothetical protein